MREQHFQFLSGSRLLLPIFLPPQRFGFDILQTIYSHSHVAMPGSTSVTGRYVQSQDAAKPVVATSPSTKKRKLNPELKDRVETFLAKANPPRKQPVIDPPAKRRRTTNAKSAAGANVVDLNGDSLGPPSTPTRSNNGSSKREAAEKRLRVFRKSPPQSYLKKLERAQTQRSV